MSDRIEHTNLRISPNKKRYYKALKYPEIPLTFEDTYITTTSGDRLDNIANQFYDDVDLWWVISIANNASTQDSLFPPLDTYIRIPGNYVEVIREFNTLNE